MKVLIVEDDPLYASQLEWLAGNLQYEIVGNCTNAFEAIDLFHQKIPDLLLLDIQIIGDIDGIQLASRINQIRKTPIIFITSISDDETFNRVQQIGPAGFIIKPFNPMQLQRMIELTVSKLENSNQNHSFQERDLILTDCFFIKVREKLVKVELKEILYIEADDRYSIIHTISEKKYIIRIPLGELEVKLPTSSFMRTHRSYIIQSKYIKSVNIQDETIQLNHLDIPMSKTHREKILDKIRRIS